MSRLVCEAIPYKSFKEKIKLTKKYDRLGDITIYDDYIFINYERGNS